MVLLHCSKCARNPTVSTYIVCVQLCELLLSFESPRYRIPPVSLCKAEGLVACWLRLLASSGCSDTQVEPCSRLKTRQGRFHLCGSFECETRYELLVRYQAPRALISSTAHRCAYVQFPTPAPSTSFALADCRCPKVGCWGAKPRQEHVEHAEA
ncbi:hypothetical protein PLICRDRAFT_182018 [Plicaturopsis crispa FD-325 SS-3]|nr:hypothetical protein PLICRDRAFT_182018 [Plicaturopsis crispa FD-325 SS-3]